MNFRATLYQLKKDYGTVISWVTILSTETNDRTGEREIRREIVDLPAIRLPQKIVRQFVQDIGYLAANKNFTYGALNDFDTAMFVVLPSDVPPGFDFNLNGWINHGGKRYDREKWDQFGTYCYMVVAKALTGTGANQATFNVRAANTLILSQRLKVEVN